MAKLIEAIPLYRLAQEKAQDPSILFHSHEEIADKCPISQIMYFAFLYIEGLYREQKLDKNDKDKYEKLIENKLQDLAFKVYCERDMLLHYENQLMNNLAAGNYAEVIEPAIHLLDYYKTHHITDRFSNLLQHSLEKNKPPQEWEF